MAGFEWNVSAWRLGPSCGGCNHPEGPRWQPHWSPPLKGQRDTSQPLGSASVCMCPLQQCSRGSLAKMLDRPVGRELLALAQAVCLQRWKWGEGAAQGAHGESGLLTTSPGFTLGRACGS